MKIWTFKGGYDNNLTYLLSDGYSNEAGIIDAAVPLSSIQPTIIKEDLSKYSWFNLGGPAEILFKPNSIDELKNFLIKKEINMYFILQVYPISKNQI